MSAALDWAVAYERSERDTAARLVRLRGEGATFHRFGDGGPTCDPSRLSDDRVGELARRHAERVVQRAINQAAEQAARPRRRAA